MAAERRALRTRALVLSPDSPYPPSTDEERDALLAELLAEIARLKADYPEEWAYFGDVTEATLVRHVGGRDEAAWFAADFPGEKVNSIARLGQHVRPRVGV